MGAQKKMKMKYARLQAVDRARRMMTGAERETTRSDRGLERAEGDRDHFNGFHRGEKSSIRETPNPFELGVGRLLVSHETHASSFNRLAATKNVGNEMPYRTVTCAAPSRNSW
jgi:hypothetical protein